MITFVLAVIFWYLDGWLGVIIALTLPTIVAMDTDSSYKEVYIVFLAFALWFVKNTGDK